MARIDKVILVAGAAGSIGSALAERLAVEQPENLILIDKDENRLEMLRFKIEERGLGCTPYVGDIRRSEHLSRIFKSHCPDLIINCAAHKHVVSGQRNVCETVHNNLQTTANLLQARHHQKHSRFVQISTDKAVEPTSVMGVSKMLCESMVRNQYPDSARFNSIVRFGNVKNTQGSVLWIWERQYASGIPLSVTDLHMKRWFMPISDACDQIMRVLGFDAGTYILDMGQMYSVEQILHDFLKSKGIDDGNYPLRFIGGKPGEKDFEKLVWGCEQVKEISAGGRKILSVSESPGFDHMRALNASCGFNDDYALKCLRKMFPEVKAWTSKARAR